MSRHSATIGIATVLCLTAAVCAQSAASPELPAGPMRAKATTACTECHDSRILLQQRLSKAAWTKEVDKMMKWGAVVDPQDRDALIDYLSSNFGVDKPPYVAERTQQAGKNKQKQ
jgi:Spy/CpxP family protein refolding chaperone